MPTPAEIAHRALADHLAALPPTELLNRYAARRDPEAFAGLVEQFGPLVLGVCRRVLGASPDVDDAFQAVFLSLARQADSFRDAKALPAWLHRVALRVSHKTLARRAPASEPAEAIADPTDPLADVAWKDVRRVLDEELDRLSDKFRGPVVLCWLDGLTQDEAAGKLGVSLATLKRRLEAGRELLRSRLIRRGLAPVLVASAVTDPVGLRAVVPEALKVLAVELGVGGVVPERIGALEVVALATTPTRRTALATLLGVGTAAAGGLAYALSRPPRPPEPAIPLAPPEQRVAIAPAPRPRLGPLQFEAVGPPLALQPGTWGTAVLFTRDGRTVISNGRHAPRAWEVSTGKVLDYEGRGADNDTPVYRFTDMWLGPDDESVVAGIYEHSSLVSLYHLADRRNYPRVFKLIDGDGNGGQDPVALSPDGNTLATVRILTKVTLPPEPRALREETVLRLWDTSHWWKSPERKPWWTEPKGPPDLTLRNPRTLAAQPRVLSLAFSPDGSTLAAVGSGSARLWDVRSGTLKWERKTPHGLNDNGLAFSPDGRWLAVSDWVPRNKASTIQVWDLITGAERTFHAGDKDAGYFCVTFHPDNRTLVAGGWASSITQWDVVTGENRGVMAVPVDGENTRQVGAVAFSPDGNTLTAVNGKGVHLWKVTRKE